MSDVNIPAPPSTVAPSNLSSGLSMNISVDNQDGHVMVNFLPSSDVLMPPSFGERLEWVKQSYERFIAKVLEKEALLGAPPAEPELN